MLSGKGPGRVVLSVEQEKTGAEGFQNVFWIKNRDPLISDFGIDFEA